MRADQAPSRATIAPRPPRTALCVMLALGLAAPTRLARAQTDSPEADSPEQKASTAYARGVELAERGEYAEAQKELERAYRLQPHPAVLYNLGQVAVALGRPAVALGHLRQFLRDDAAPGSTSGGSGSTDERRRAVEAQVRDLERRVGTLDLSVEPAGADVTVDDVAVGRSPLPGPLSVDPGEHRVAASLAGFAEATTTLSAFAGQRARLHLRLPPLPAKASPTEGLGFLRASCPGPDAEVLLDGEVIARTAGETTLTVPAGAYQVAFRRGAMLSPAQSVSVAARGTARARCPWPGAERPSAASVRLEAERDEGLGTRQLGGIALAGTGAALAGTALAVGLWNQGRYDDWRREDQALARSDQMKPDWRERLDANNERQSSIETMNTITIVLGVAAVGAIAAGAFLFFRQPPRPAPGPRTPLALEVRW